jgi:predicted DNA-binding transcriptional regulator YafY
MLETSARLLRVLSLLQTRRDWTGSEIAQRLGVTTRTVRKDMDRLRALGYQIDARPGAAGGYRLGHTGALPPLLLDDEEAVAVAIGLRTAATGSVTGIEEASVRAMTKVLQVLPARLRHRVEAIRLATLSTPTGGPRVGPDLLTTIAAACRDHDVLRFDYRSHTGDGSERRVEPHRLIHHRQRWYLLGWDRDRDDWRTFRADRVTEARVTGGRFTARALPPEQEIMAKLARDVGQASWRYRARVVVHAPAEYVRGRIPVPVDVEELDAGRCSLEPGSDHPAMLALYLGLLEADFEVIDSPPLVEALRELALRYQRAVDASAH